jgi:hypothetical protein
MDNTQRHIASGAGEALSVCQLTGRASDLQDEPWWADVQLEGARLARLWHKRSSGPEGWSRWSMDC